MILQEISQVSWHGKGDYFASVMPKGDSKAVLIHQLSKQRSQVNSFSNSFIKTEITGKLWSIVR